MNNSFKANNELVEKLILYYQDYKVEPTQDTILFQAKTCNFSVLIYKNNTVLFQGKNFEDDLNVWNNMCNTSSCIEDIFEIDGNCSHIGSDEVGCGDYFGGVVVCACYVKEKDIQLLKDLGVKDSKQLNDTQIVKLAEQIKKIVTSACFTLTPSKYNELHDDKKYNLNKIKAILHNFVITKLIKKTKFNDFVVIDQFCEARLYYNYLSFLNANEISKDIYFTTKAENKFIAVACASIIARAQFLKEIYKISNEIKKDIILGASDKVDDLAKTILNEKGMEYLKNYVKYHFKNTTKIQECGNS